jgi:hypothetical protein
LAVALGSVDGLTVRLVAWLAVSVYPRLPVRPLMLLSVAVIVNVYVPVVVGVPLSTPVVELRDSHDGRLPEVTANVYVPEPPVALRVVL